MSQEVESIECERCTMTFKVERRHGKCSKSLCPDCKRPFLHGAKHLSGPITTSIDPRDLDRWQRDTF